MIETLDATIESLYGFAREQDSVPVSAQRLLWLKMVIGDTYAQNDDGDWLHISGARLDVQDPEQTIYLEQGDVNTLVELIRRRADPGYFLLEPASLSDCEEILDARILSFEHTDPARERKRRATAAERGVPYVPPVGEGVITTCRDIELNLNNVGSLEAAVSDRGKGRYAHLPMIRVAGHNDGMLFRPVEDILSDMTHRERGIYRRYCKESRKKGFPAGQEYAKKLAAEAIREARECGTEGLWQGNLRWQLREQVVTTFGLRQGMRDDRDYFSYPPNGYDLDTPVAEGSRVADPLKLPGWSDVLCQAQLRAIARMHLHNQLLDLYEEGKLPVIGITGRAPRIDHPAIQAIARAHGGSYLDFLQEVSQHGSEGLLRGEPANNPSIAKSAAGQHITEIESRMVITESIRQMMPKWFVRRLVDKDRLPPSPLHGRPEQIIRVERRPPSI